MSDARVAQVTLCDVRTFYRLKTSPSPSDGNLASGIEKGDGAELKKAKLTEQPGPRRNAVRTNRMRCRIEINGCFRSGHKYTRAGALAQREDNTY